MLCPPIYHDPVFRLVHGLRPLRVFFRLYGSDGHVELLTSHTAWLQRQRDCPGLSPGPELIFGECACAVHGDVAHRGPGDGHTVLLGLPAGEKATPGGMVPQQTLFAELATTGA